MRANSNLQISPELTSDRKTFTTQNVRSLLQSTSFVIPNRNVTEQSSFKSEILKDSGTQTSKTVISLNLVDDARMSPDSLSPNTDCEPDLGCSSNNEQFNTPRFSRKGCIVRYLHKPKKKDKEQDGLPLYSLTKVFLEKSKRKKLENQSPKVTRSNFLQQTSPLRKIIPSDQEKNLKCSYANVSSQMTPPNPNPRFTVKRTREKVDHVEIVKPINKQLWEKELTLKLNLESTRTSPKNLRSHSFMSPTFSSEQKNKMREIRTVTKLISPTRRGRSASPKTKIKRSTSTSIQTKIPYIDKSSSSIFHGIGDSVYDLNIKLSKMAVSTVSNSKLSEISTDNHPEQELVQAIAKMKNSDWNLALRGLAEIVEICRTADINMVYPHMTVINQRMIDMLKSSRSHICRTTCKAVGHLFEYVKDTRRPEFDEIVDTLLNRTADSNKFIRQDANMALDCMVTHIPTMHAIRALCAKGPDHKNTLVRLATARLLVCVVVIAGPASILNPNNSDYTRRRIILNMVKFLSDKTLEPRKYGERLYKLFNGDRMFEIYIRRYLEKETLQKFKLCLKTYQKHNC
ncbi:hypothetical protein ABEB36_005081 [Hypothenemus hampei]|uniref:TOG domain-containing protein n=1 Tax=Hypothenemus hampei TaxID=57062 RepID=A0ABD1EZX6_HYPHA